MSAERFSLDTNILVYAVDRLAGERHDVCRNLLWRAASADCVLTTIALGEFFVVATRKGKMPVPDAASQVRDWIEIFPVVGLDPAAVLRATSAAEKRLFGFWDACVLASADMGMCSVVFSEDMADGVRLGSVTVRRPFAGGRLTKVAERLLGAATG
jgi:predicted nucleic acid-binding protein